MREVEDCTLAWKYLISLNNYQPLTVIDDDAVQYSVLDCMRSVVTHVERTVRRKLGSKEPTPVNTLNMMCTRDVFSLLADNFQLSNTGLHTNPTSFMYAAFLGVTLK